MLDYDITIGDGRGHHKDCKGVEICSCYLVVIPVVVQRTQSIGPLYWIIFFGRVFLTTILYLFLFCFLADPPQARYHGTLRPSSLQPDAEYSANALRQ